MTGNNTQYSWPKKQDNTQSAILVLLGVIVLFAVIGVVARPSQAVNILGFCGVIAAQLGVLMLAKQNQVQVEAVRTTLVASDNAMAQSINTVKEISLGTHKLVNSGNGVQLAALAKLTRWKANTTLLPEDAVEADTAEQAYLDHVAAQSRVDDTTSQDTKDKILAAKMDESI